MGVVSGISDWPEDVISTRSSKYAKVAVLVAI